MKGTISCILTVIMIMTLFSCFSKTESEDGVLVSVHFNIGDADKIGPASALLSCELDYSGKLNSSCKVLFYYSENNTDAASIFKNGKHTDYVYMAEGKTRYSIRVRDLLPNTGYYYIAVVSTKDEVFIDETVESFNTIAEYVDLGPGMKWATCNLGAEYPEDYGRYYAWGETKAKDEYTWGTYEWCDGSYLTVKNNYVDTVTELLGSKWCTPSINSWNRLRDGCKWSWTTQNGVYGRLVTSIVEGYEGRSIFIPAAGYKSDFISNKVGEDGFYWSSSLCEGDEINAWAISFKTYMNPSGFYRCYGLSIRPLYKQDQFK